MLCVATSLPCVSMASDTSEAGTVILLLVQCWGKKSDIEKESKDETSCILV